MVLLAAVLAASVVTLPAPAEAGGSNGAQMVCRNMTYTGSRLGSTRVCKTKAEWNEIQAEHDRLVRQQQAADRTLKSN